MGIDPGLAKLGWGIIEVEDNDKPVLVDYGCINTSSAELISYRLDYIYKQLRKLVKRLKPNEVAVEKLFFSSNAKTAMDVAQARGVVMVALNHTGIKVSEYTPLEIKLAVVGYGRAQKKQVQYMVKHFLNLAKVPKSDHAADALAAAICHNNSRKLAQIKMKI